MTRTHVAKLPCAVCHRLFDPHVLRPWITIRPSVSNLIHAAVPDWDDGKYICREDLATFRRSYVEGMLQEERGELSDIEKDVVESFETGLTISENLEDLVNERKTLGDRMADRLAAFGGSWTFILSFLAVLILWMLLNVTGWLFKPFDDYPFILLNLVLSCLAALQAPIIMMSQKRQEAKDRLRAENDFKVNLKAELEIRQLHEKIDHQLSRQWQRLAELQEIQIEMLEEQSGKR